MTRTLTQFGAYMAFNEVLDQLTPDGGGTLGTALSQIVQQSAASAITGNIAIVGFTALTASFSQVIQWVRRLSDRQLETDKKNQASTATFRKELDRLEKAQKKIIAQTDLKLFQLDVRTEKRLVDLTYRNLLSVPD